jgi:hypothetical protein
MSEYDGMWMDLEIMGHQRIVGQVREVKLAGLTMLEVVVPATSRYPSFRHMLGGAALFRLKPISEASARALAEMLALPPPGAGIGAATTLVLTAGAEHVAAGAGGFVDLVEGESRVHQALDSGDDRRNPWGDPASAVDRAVYDRAVALHRRESDDDDDDDAESSDDLADDIEGENPRDSVEPWRAYAGVTYLDGSGGSLVFTMERHDDVVSAEMSPQTGGPLRGLGKLMLCTNDIVFAVENHCERAIISIIIEFDTPERPAVAIEPEVTTDDPAEPTDVDPLAADPTPRSTPDDADIPF